MHTDPALNAPPHSVTRLVPNPAAQRFAAKALQVLHQIPCTSLREENVITQMVNGRVMSAVVDERERARSLDGLLGLQLHTGAPMKIEFRNVW